MSDIAQQDIAYQPATKAYAFSTNPSSPVNPKLPRKPINLRFLPILLGEITGLIFIFLIFLFVLNYFKLINLSAISPIFNNLPASSTIAAQDLKPYNISDTNQYEISGTLEKYNQNTVNLKFAQKNIVITYDYNTRFYFSKTTMNNDIATPAAETIAILDFPSNILKQTNVGKNVIVDFTIEKNKYVLYTLTLNN